MIEALCRPAGSTLESCHVVRRAASQCARRTYGLGLQDARHAAKADADFDRYAAAANTFATLRKEYLAALAHQPGGAVQAALIKLKGIRDSADEVLFANAEQPGDPGETDWAAEAQGMEAACAKLRSKIDAFAASSDWKSSDGGGEAKELAAKVDAFRKKLKALEVEVEKAADAVAKAEAASQDIAERGRQLKAEIDQEIAAAEAKLGHDARAR
jgi:hypothetical protein